MQPPISKTSRTSEIERLRALLPDELRSQVTITPFEDNPRALITAKKLAQSQFLIQINLHQWHFFTANQRNLLFWREVARIQHRAIDRSSWEPVAMSIGLSAALMELLSHSLFSFVIALSVTGLASYKLYQRKLGEQSIREATAADQAAIELAIQCGYSFAAAHDSLYQALRILAKQPTQKFRWNHYQVRLRVLEMLAARRDEFDQPLDLCFDRAERSENLGSRLHSAF